MPGYTPTIKLTMLMNKEVYTEVMKTYCGGYPLWEDTPHTPHSYTTYGCLSRFTEEAIEYAKLNNVDLHLVPDVNFKKDKRTSVSISRESYATLIELACRSNIGSGGIPPTPVQNRKSQCLPVSTALRRVIMHYYSVITHRDISYGITVPLTPPFIRHYVYLSQELYDDLHSVARRMSNKALIYYAVDEMLYQCLRHGVDPSLYPDTGKKTKEMVIVMPEHLAKSISCFASRKRMRIKDVIRGCISWYVSTVNGGGTENTPTGSNSLTR